MTEDAVIHEWRVIQERLRRGERHWALSERWQLHTLTEEPPAEWLLRFMPVLAEFVDVALRAPSSAAARALQGRLDRMVNEERDRQARESVAARYARNVTSQASVSVAARVRALPQGFDEAKYLASVRALPKHERSWGAVCARLLIDHGITVSPRRLPEWVRAIGAARPRDVAD
ncbi:MAG: hypothetical protein KF809_14890 [Chloroflexi bacterium]|nr:hypothetical protein [Chloroflexota bacterium]